MNEVKSLRCEEYLQSGRVFWEDVVVISPEVPKERYNHGFAALSDGSFLLHGGIGVDRSVLQDVWRISLTESRAPQKGVDVHYTCIDLTSSPSTFPNLKSMQDELSCESISIETDTRKVVCKARQSLGGNVERYAASRLAISAASGSPAADSIPSSAPPRSFHTLLVDSLPESGVDVVFSIGGRQFNNRQKPRASSTFAIWQGTNGATSWFLSELQSKILLAPLEMQLPEDFSNLSVDLLALQSNPDLQRFHVCPCT